MNIKPRHRRLIMLIIVLVMIGAACGLILDALNKNIDFYVSPSSLLQKNPAAATWLRLGGIVKPGSVHYSTDHQSVTFIVTDYTHEVTVQFKGLLPDLFSPGRDVVANGHWQTGIFVASEILAKHDNNYMPKEVKNLIADAQKKHLTQTPQNQDSPKNQVTPQNQNLRKTRILGSIAARHEASSTVYRLVNEQYRSFRNKERHQKSKFYGVKP